MFLTVLSAAGQGNINSVAEFATSYPYVKLITEKISRKTKKLVSLFVIFMSNVESLKSILTNCSISEAEVSFSLQIQAEIVKKTIENNYSMKDKLEAIKIVNENNELISKSPREYSEMLRINGELTVLVQNVFLEAQSPPFSETLTQRGIQAEFENLSTPEEITKKFWPII